MQPQDYEKMVGEDDRRDSSSTEVEDSLIMDDDSLKGWGGPGPRDRSAKEGAAGSRRSRLAKTWRSWRWTVDTGLLLVILALLVRDRAREPSGGRPAVLEIGGDLTGVRTEHFSQQITKFDIDYSYAPDNSSAFFTDEVLGKWNELMPIGMGFVWVNETHRYHDLPTPVDWDQGKTVFTTSITHNLHCLFAIVQTYSGLKSGHPIPDDHHWHMTHCFAYMRQAIMCSADIALEGRETTFPDHNGGSDGWDSKHVCKDYSEVKAYLEGVRAYDDRLIY